MIVDMRLRPPLPTWVGQAQFEIATDYYPTRIGFSRPASAEQRSMDLLISEMDAAEIELGVIMGRQSAEPLGMIPNDEIADVYDSTRSVSSHGPASTWHIRWRTVSKKSIVA